MKQRIGTSFCSIAALVLGSALGPQGMLPNTNPPHPEHTIKVTSNLLTAVGRNVAHTHEPSHHNFLFKGVVGFTPRNKKL